MHSLTEENYLKALYQLGNTTTQGDWVNNRLVCEALQIKASSVTAMLKQLADKQLLDYEPYKGARLNKEGRLLALKVIRKHRIWEVFLHRQLGYMPDEVHAIAEQLEHIQHPDLVDRLDAWLQFPQIDPHGDPIPNRAGEVKTIEKQPLAHQKAGFQGVVSGLSDQYSDLLRHLLKAGIALNAHIALTDVVDLPPSDTLYVFCVDGASTTTITKVMAQQIFVTPA
jgi:DtxR family Mn-dependent transcriptional regulator